MATDGGLEHSFRNESASRPPSGPFAPAGEPRRALAGYEILSALGSGTGGTVYLARRGVGSPVALKVLPAKLAHDPEARARFLREARCAERIPHPAVVRVTDAGEAQNHFYIAMEYVPGTTLRERLARGPLPPLEAAQLVAVVARAIEAAHAAGIVHRDLKPGNILLDRAGKPRVADFGLARDLLAPERLTRSGDLLGTPMYMAPEQIQGQRVGPPADVWALGVILWECLAGSTPFRGRHLAELSQSIRAGRPAAPSTAAPGAVPGAIDAACLSALHADPEARPGAGELAATLEAVTAEPSQEVPARGRPGSRATVVLVALAASLGLAIGALATSAIDRGRAKERAREVEAEAVRSRENVLEAAKLSSEREAEAKRARELASEREADSKRERELGASFLVELAAERVSWGDSVAELLDSVIRDLAAAPPTAATARLRARLLLNRGRSEEALACVREALARPELARDPELLRIRADACFLVLRRARDESQEASRLLSECKDALGRLEEVDRGGARGIYASVKKRELFEHARPDHEALVRELESARSLDPTFAAAPMLEAEILSGLRERVPDSGERVLAALAAAIRADPTDAAPYYRRSAVYWMQCLATERPGAPPPRDLQDRCIRDLKYARAIDLVPYHFVEEGKLYTMLGRPREAPAALEAALARAPRGSFEWISALTWRGNMKVLLGDERGAVDDWATAGEIDPGAAHELFHYRHRLPPALEADLERRAPKLGQFRDELTKAAASSDPGERAQANGMLEDMTER